MTTPTSIHESVREYYAERVRQTDSCCGPVSRSDTKNVFYPEKLITNLPDDVANFSLGCGDPITLAGLQPGQAVLDLGSGGGLDCFLAAKQVGETGRVIGVDMTPEMIKRATASAKRLGIKNVEFRQGFLEDLPVQSGSVDVVISNCVINLTPDKAKVFGEAFRVLKPGGRLAVSDIVTDGPLPDAIKHSLSAWAGCVAGAVEAQDYIGMMRAAGFADISITPVYFDRQTIDSALAEFEDVIDLKTVSQEAIYKTVYSAKITAYKPV